MQSPFSLLSPFVICAASAGFIVLIVASIFLIRDLIKMRREYQAGVPSVWHRRPTTMLSLSVLGLTLLGFLFAFLLNLPDPLPFWILTNSLAGIAFVISCNILISDLRNVQRERREGLPSVWHRRPKTLLLIALVTFEFGPLLDVGYRGYEQALGFPYKPIPHNIIFNDVVPSLFFFLSLVLFIYAAILQMLNRHSS